MVDQQLYSEREYLCRRHCRDFHDVKQFVHCHRTCVLKDRPCKFRVSLNNGFQQIPAFLFMPRITGILLRKQSDKRGMAPKYCPNNLGTPLSFFKIGGQELPMLLVWVNWLERYPSELSSGELQCVCVARALRPELKFLLCDDEFTNRISSWHIRYARH